MSDNFIFWDKSKDVPESALTKITGGRLKGKSDIKPQWRLQIMTEMFGPIGIGWNYKVTDRWIEDFFGTVSAHVMIELVYRVPDTEEWSLPVPGQGGSMLVAKEKEGPYHSDEAFKMATTDALSVAMKQIGVAANVYLGKTTGVPDGSKYNKPIPKTETIKQATAEQRKELEGYAVEFETVDPDKSDYISNQLGRDDLPFSKAADILRKLK